MRSRLAWTVASVADRRSVQRATPRSRNRALNFSLGYFTVRGEDARVDGDVLVANRDLFLFDFNDFNSVSLGAEWLAPLGDYLEVGAGHRLSPAAAVDTIYDDFVRPDGREIEQELKLRIVPITATVRVLPLGRHAAFQPYVGGGIGIYNWRYSETGDFIDFTLPGRPIFRESYVGRPARPSVRSRCSARGLPLGNAHLRRRNALPESRRRSRRARFPGAEDRPRRLSLPRRRSGFGSERHRTSVCVGR